MLTCLRPRRVRKRGGGRRARESVDSLWDSEGDEGRWEPDVSRELVGKSKLFLCTCDFAHCSASSRA